MTTEADGVKPTARITERLRKAPIAVQQGMFFAADLLEDAAKEIDRLSATHDELVEALRDAHDMFAEHAHKEGPGSDEFEWWEATSAVLAKVAPP